MKSENLYLVRRREMLRLLRDACAEFSAASVVPEAAAELPAEGTNFLKFEHDHLWIAQPDAWNASASGSVAEDPIGHELSIGFLRSEGRFAFKSVVTQQRILADHPHGPVSGLRLVLPLRLGRVETREEFRLEVPDEHPIYATLTPTSSRRQSWALQIKNISTNGLGGVVQPEPDASLEHHAICWIEVPLEEHEQPLSFMVRLRHLRPIPESEAVTTGWSLCPSDDSTSCQRKLRRLQDYLSERVSAVA